MTKKTAINEAVRELPSSQTASPHFPLNQSGQNSLKQCSYSYEGVIPPPEYLKGYQNIDPSIPDRIITMAEKEQEMNARFIERGFDLKEKVLENDFNIAKRGQIFAMVIILSSFVTGAIAAFFQAFVPSGIAFGVAGIIGWLMKHPSSQEKSTTTSKSKQGKLPIENE